MNNTPKTAVKSALYPYLYAEDGTPFNREVQSRSRGLTLKDLGNPQDVFKHTEEDKPEQYWTMGLVLGQCNGFVSFTDKTELKVLTGMKGFFRMFPSNPKRAISEGGILYFPAGIHEALTAILHEKNAPSQVSFAIEFRVHRDTNASGRTYTVRSILPIKPHASDPLAQLEAVLMGDAKFLPGSEEKLQIGGSAPPVPAVETPSAIPDKAPSNAKKR